jgi:putative ATP-binding cassette transporter
MPVGFIGHVRAFLAVLRLSRERGWILAFGAGIVVVVIMTVIGQLRLNKWQGSFYQAISDRDLHGFMMQLVVFAVVAAILVALNYGQTWLQEMLKIRLRAGLTNDLLDQWLQPQQAYRLALVGEIGVNPDQRLQEDVRHLSELTASLAIGLFQASVLLFGFVDVLWALSDKVRFMIGGVERVVPGYMVWCAAIYALAGSALAWWVGRPLIRLNEEHYAREADLRFAMVRVSEAAEGIALYAGEPAERSLLDATLTRVLSVMKQLANRLAGLIWVTASYGYVAMVVPIIVASPGYFSGTLNFGELMMVVGAFNQVQSSLRWWVDNFPALADWRATFQRVMTLYDGLIGIGKMDQAAPGIKITHAGDRLRMVDLAITVPNGVSRLDQREVTIEPGQHVQISGTAGSGKAMLFRVLAELWTSGSGAVELPDRRTMMFMPQRPYLPQGTLAEVLAYPEPAGSFADAALIAAIERVGLKHHADGLAETRRWDRVLTLGEQHAVTFARALVHKPAWIILDEVLETLEGEIEWVVDLMTHDLQATTIVSIDGSTIEHELFSRTLRLSLQPSATRPAEGMPAEASA